jgi:hypothetical protein
MMACQVDFMQLAATSTCFLQKICYNFSRFVFSIIIALTILYLWLTQCARPLRIGLLSNCWFLTGIGLLFLERVFKIYLEFTPHKAKIMGSNLYLFPHFIKDFLLPGYYQVYISHWSVNICPVSFKKNRREVTFRNPDP